MKRFLVVVLVVGILLSASALAPAFQNDGEHSPGSATVTKIGFIGDSITVGTQGTYNAVQNEMDALGDGYAAVNRGMGGATTEDWLPGTTYFSSTQTVFKSEKVAIVSIMLGVNDANKLKLAPEQYAANMRTITAELLKDPNIRFVIINYPTYVQREGSRQKQITRDLEGYSRVLDTVVNGGTVIKGDSEAYGYFKTHPTELPGGIHPNDAGYKALGELWANALKRHLVTR